MKPRHLYIRIVVFLILSIGLALPALAAAQASPQVDPGINKIYITDVRDVGFTVSWTTDAASDGIVTYGTSIPPTIVKADTIASTTTHWVEIIDLLPNTTYYFSVKSGDPVDNNGGVYYQVQTGPTLGVPSTDITIWGYVYQSDGTTPVANAIVYLQLQNNDSSGSLGSSQWISKRTGSTGGWNFALGSTRTADLLSYFTYTKGADLLRIVGQGGSAGTKGADPTPWTITIPMATSQQNIILNSAPTAINLVAMRAYNGQQSFIPVILGLGLVVLLTPMVLWYRKNKLSQKTA